MSLPDEVPPFTSSHCDPLGLTNKESEELVCRDLLSHALRQLRDKKTLTFTRCDCLSVCLRLISLPLLVGSSAARRQIDSAGCKQRRLIGVVTVCLFNPPSNQSGSPKWRAFSAASHKCIKQEKERKGRKEKRKKTAALAVAALAPSECRKHGC